MFNNFQRGHVTTIQRAKINQENEGVQLTNNKGMVVNQSRGPGSLKQVFGDVKNKLDVKSTPSGGFPNSKNTPFQSSRRTVQHELLKPQQIQFDEGLFPKSSPFPTYPIKRTVQHELLNPQSIQFHKDNDESSLDIDSLLDAFPIPKPKPGNYGYTNNLFNFTDDEINDVMFQNIDEYQESPKLYNDDFNLREIPMPVHDMSFSDELPLCMNPSPWEAGNNSILDLFNSDNSSTSFASSKEEAMDEEDELPDFFTFKFD